MAQGNWNPSVINPKPRCRICCRVVNKCDLVRLDGFAPAHRVCCEDRGRSYTNDKDFRPARWQAKGKKGIRRP